MINKKLSTLDIVHCSLFTALIAIGAFIKIMIPLGVYEVTFSLQFLFALLAGIVLGPKKGFFSVLTYLLIGLMGIPIFAHGGGLGYILKPTFGFLIGFAFAALLAGIWKERLGKTSFSKLLFACFVGEMAYYACGLIYYFVSFNFILAKGTAIGVAELLSVWFLSTVGPDFVLCVIAAVLGKRLIPILSKVNK